jgi:BirA family biotin operon repressor/biotin-[acetyl-CoA-carboxylase] ligase
VDRKLDALLHELMQNMTIAVSGEKLARDLGVSHSTLARWIEKLRAAGCAIHGELFTGYRLTRLPDILLPQLIRPRLRSKSLGRTLYHFYTIDSTNAFALRLITHERKVAHGTVILAESQTAGRGRMGRTWHSEPENGLYLSVVLRLDIPPTVAPLVTLGCAVALRHAIVRVAQIPVDIKWPNDILVNKKKVAGILAEIQAEVDRVHMLVVGVGLNVNQDSMPGELADRAMSLRMASGRNQSRIEILVEFLEQFEWILERFHSEGPSSLIHEWSRHSSFASGRRLKVYDGVRTIEGTTVGLNPLGALRIHTVEGPVEEVYSGDVVEW